MHQRIVDAVRRPRRAWLSVLALAWLLGACGAPWVPVEAPELLVLATDGGDAAPLDGAALEGTVRVRVDATAALGTVRYFLDAEPTTDVALATLTVAPYELVLDTRALANGEHRMVAAASVSANGGWTEVHASATFTVANPDPVANQPPTVDAGADAVATAGTPIDLVGSVDDDGLPAATVGVAWSVVSGPADGTFSAPHALATSVVFPEAGTYVVRMSATDGAAGASDDLTVVVEPSAPPSGGPSPEYDDLEQVYVAPGGSDAAAGTMDAPLRTVAEGLRRAVANRAKGLGTRVLLLPGTYRESLAAAYASTLGPLIVIEAYQRHQAVISGADRFTDWSCGAGACTHAWTNDWGASPNPWPGDIAIGELALRREMVVVNGVSLTQVASVAALTPGSFYVDEGANLLRVVPPAGVDLAGSEVEVAVRPVLLRTQGLSNLVIDGVVFRHAASQFRQAAVDIVDQTDVTLRNARVEWNGQNGLSLKGRRFTVEDVSIAHNGSSGIVGYRLTDTLVRRVDVSFNNWRGELGGYTTWEVGNKFVQAHRVAFEEYRATHNRSRGLWLDSDNADITIDGAVLCDNLEDGLFVEANQGPLTLRDATLCRNGAAGLLTSATMNFTVQRTTIEANLERQVNLSGSFGHAITDWESGQRYDLENRDWSWTENTIRSAGGGPVITTTYPSSGWTTLMSTSTFDRNQYASSTANTFQVSGGAFVDFAGWKANTGQDGSSSFALE